jgi:hypothetical protein
MIEAIPTFYNDRWHRSRTEAYWSVFFHTARIRTDFEMQGWNVGGLKYLPDFYLPDVKTSEEKGCFGEVKGQYPTPLEITKLRSICDPLACAGLVLIGRPNPEGQLLWLTAGRGRVYRQSFLSELFGDVDKAFFAAQTARFEHGEYGSELYRRIEQKHKANEEHSCVHSMAVLAKSLLDHLYFVGEKYGAQTFSADWFIKLICAKWLYYKWVMNPPDGLFTEGMTVGDFFATPQMTSLMDGPSLNDFTGSDDYQRMNEIDEFIREGLKESLPEVLYLLRQQGANV